MLGIHPPRNNRVVYQNIHVLKTGIHHPEIAGLYTNCYGYDNALRGIHHPEIAGLYTKDLIIDSKATGIHHPEITGLNIRLTKTSPPQAHSVRGGKRGAICIYLHQTFPSENAF